MLESVFLSEKYVVKTVHRSNELLFRIVNATGPYTSRILLVWNVKIVPETLEAESGLNSDCYNSNLQNVSDNGEWTNPSQNDKLFIFSAAKPVEYHSSVTSFEINAIILWSTLYWYFHQEPPSTRLNISASSKTPYSGKPKEGWRICIAHHGLFEDSTLLSQIEKIRLVHNDASVSQSHGSLSRCSYFFASRCSFWQLDASIYLALLSVISDGAENRFLTAYSPSMPLQYVMSNGVRHPSRPNRPNQGEQFYKRFINSLSQVLSFRVALHLQRTDPNFIQLSSSEHTQSGDLDSCIRDSRNGISDVVLLHKWMNDPRVYHFWGMNGPQKVQDDFLAKALNCSHSFPIIGYWDDRPFGYFEVYWVKEDILGRYLGSDVGDWDRGIHCLVGEQDFRGPHRVKAWLSALVHYSFLADDRTQVVMLEPRVDNLRLVLLFHKQPVRLSQLSLILIQTRKISG